MNFTDTGYFIWLFGVLNVAFFVCKEKITSKYSKEFKKLKIKSL